ncbi:hypothetical protein GTP56_27435 [Duganella sp. FT134W]|uniref:Uncharacterized protein n=1 Tax=Duganella margarita TaxID=2692170 RepID=A0A7X4H7B2_9BURK|nr:DUF5695 domain-containing protein [Duganella margarita]MYM75904.1 hypothetical protein [Duganella margarita]
MTSHFSAWLLPVAVLAASPALAADYPAIQTKAYSTPQLLFALRTDTQTLARLTPVADPSHDFTLGPREQERQFDGYRHIGDLTLKLRQGGGAWQDYTSYTARQPIRVLPAVRALATADISASFGAGLPLTVERRWINDKGTLVLRYTLINRSKQPVEVAEAGMPLIVDQSGGVKARPGDQGVVEVRRPDGQRPTLRIQPDGRTPLNSWQPPVEQRATGENHPSWVTGGFTLKPGARRDIGLRFVVR